MKKKTRWTFKIPWPVLLAILVGPPLLVAVPLLIIFLVSTGRHIHHYHAVAAHLAKAKPEEWQELATACQTMVDRFEHKTTTPDNQPPAPLPPALQALEPAYEYYDKGRYVFKWAGGFDDAVLQIEFEHGVLVLRAARIPEIPLPEGEAQMWPVTPHESDAVTHAK